MLRHAEMNLQVEEIFHEIADLSAEERAYYFERHGVEGATREEVEALLTFDLGSSASLARAVGHAAQNAIDRFEQAEPKGLRCGPYCLGDRLGRGGMGTVYLAERVDGEVKHRVAVKLLRPGADDPLLRERFLAERQILATLSHRNIARLFDAGHREDGQPYLAMEYIEGKAIDTYAAGLDMRNKIRLFLKVCAAAGYLHRNLVVHRDLKPANILVTAEGEPKLLDFGIAKMLDLTADCTVTCMRMLTPEYASPEQVAGGAVSTATDIYSLGAVLYKLVTGSSPHRFEDDSAEAIALAISKGASTPPSKLAPASKGDLETILLKALRREAQERYATVEQFAEDLESYLEARPIRARKGDAWYRARKFVRRYWLPIAAATLAAGGLAGGALVANHQRGIAQRRFGQVRQLANVFLFDFERSIRDVPGTLDARALVASTGQRYLKQLAAESQYDPALQREIGDGYERLAEIQDSLQSGGGKSPGVTDSLRAALEIHRRLGDDRSSIGTLRRKYIELASLTGYRYQDEHNAREATRWANEAMRLGEEWIRTEPRNPNALVAAAAAFMRGSTTQEVGGQTAAALGSLEKAAAWGESAIAVAPADATTRIIATDAQRIYSELLESVKRYSDALVHGERALRLIEPLCAQRSGDPVLRLKLEAANSAAGMAEHHLGEHDPKHLERALPYLRRSYELADEAMQEDPRNLRNKSLFVAYCSRYCSLLVTTARFEDAAKLYSKAAGVTRELVVLDPNNRRSWYLLGTIQLNLGWMYFKSRQYKRAREAFLAADQGFMHGLAMDPADTVMLECRAGQFEGLARTAWILRDSYEARRQMARCLGVMREMIRRDASVKTYIFDYAGKLQFARQIGLPTTDLD